MPHIILISDFHGDYGFTNRTIVGDDKSDPQLMHYLGASLTTQNGANGKDVYRYVTGYAPRIVLDKLEARGYKVTAMTALQPSNTDGSVSFGRCFWTLHRKQQDNGETNNNQDQEPPPYVKVMPK